MPHGRQPLQDTPLMWFHVDGVCERTKTPPEPKIFLGGACSPEAVGLLLHGLQGGVRDGAVGSHFAELGSLSDPTNEPFRLSATYNCTSIKRSILVV
jgi:hypothetical protein